MPRKISDGLEIRVRKTADKGPVITTSYLPRAPDRVIEHRRAVLPTPLPHDVIVALAQIEDARRQLDEYGQGCFELGVRYALIEYGEKKPTKRVRKFGRKSA